MKKTFWQILTAGVLTVMLYPVSVIAYPNRPVQIVVPAGAGGVNDMLGRLVAKHLSEQWNQSVLVMNRPGASGIVAANLFAQTEPDGHTIGVISSVLVGAWATKDDARSSRDNLTGVIRLATPRVFVATRKDAPFDDLQQLINHAKTNGKKISYATSGVASSGHILMSYVGKSLDLDWVHVPYKSNVAAWPDVIAGRVDLNIGPFPEHTVTDQGLKIIGTINDSVSVNGRALQSLSTIGSDFRIDVWFGLVVPKGTPKKVTEKLHADMIKVLANPDFKKEVQKLNITPELRPAENFDREIDADISRLSGMLKKSGVQIE